MLWSTWIQSGFLSVYIPIAVVVFICCCFYLYLKYYSEKYIAMNIISNCYIFFDKKLSSLV